MGENTLKGTNLEDYKDISHEGYREYYFANGASLYISNPTLLHVSASGGHRVVATIDMHTQSWEGGYRSVGYYVKPSEGWYIMWYSKNEFPFVT